MSTGTIVKCESCGKEFEKPNWSMAYAKHHYCSRECVHQRAKVKCTCDWCGKEFMRRKCEVKKYQSHYCNAECQKSHHTSGTHLTSCKTCGKEFKVQRGDVEKHLYCSRTCRNMDFKKQIEIPCLWCGKTVQRIPSHVKETTFCSCSCRAKYHVRQRQGFRRSYGEKYLAELIMRDFPDSPLLENKKNLLPSGLEIDIFLKDINLAIELNGPCHYFNIYGEDTLKNVQARDAQKQAEIQQIGYRFIVLDISTISDRKKLEKFLSLQYESNIKPLIETFRPVKHLPTMACRPVKHLPTMACPLVVTQ